MQNFSLYASVKPLVASLLATVLLGSAHTGFAHTSFETSVMLEGVRVLNNVQIGHACGAGTSVIGTSVVFPDGLDSTITVDGAPYSGPLTDFVLNWGPSIQPLLDRSVFTNVDEKNSPAGNVVGLWAGGGPGMPNHMVAYVPFRVNATNINPASCVASVKFFAPIVDVCRITAEAELHSEGAAHFWTGPALATVYDNGGTSDESAKLTINRNAATNPLPANCNTGLAVEVKVSPAQLLRDMPIKIQGVQIWPKN